MMTTHKEEKEKGRSDKKEFRQGSDKSKNTEARLMKSSSLIFWSFPLVSSRVPNRILPLMCEVTGARIKEIPSSCSPPSLVHARVS